MFKTACILLWKYVRDNNLLFKVKFLIPCHDEINIEVPDEMAEIMVKVVKDCMLKSAAMFCKKLPIPADAEVGKYWIH